MGIVLTTVYQSGSRRAEQVMWLLAQIKDLEKNTDGKTYSNASLAEVINQNSLTYLDVEEYERSILSDYNIWTYLTGKKSEKDSIRIRSIPDQYRLDAIEKFVFNCSEIGKAYSSTTDGYGGVPLPALVLSAHLLEGNNENITSTQLEGTFTFSNELNDYKMEFSPTDSTSILNTVVILSEPKTQDTKDRLTVKKYIGWAVISPEDYIFIVTKGENNRNNYYFCISEIHSKAYEDTTVAVEYFLAVEGSLPYGELYSKYETERVETQMTKDLFMLFNRL